MEHLSLEKRPRWINVSQLIYLSNHLQGSKLAHRFTQTRCHVAVTRFGNLVWGTMGEEVNPSLKICAALEASGLSNTKAIESDSRSLSDNRLPIYLLAWGTYGSALVQYDVITGLAANMPGLLKTSQLY